jgi:hypothetical protein
MATFIIDVPKNKEIDFLSYLSKINYIKIKDRSKIKEKFKKNVTEALQEVELMQQGKVDQAPFESFFQELINEKRNNNQYNTN